MLELQRFARGPRVDPTSRICHRQFELLRWCSADLRRFGGPLFWPVQSPNGEAKRQGDNAGVFSSGFTTARASRGERALCQGLTFECWCPSPIRALRMRCHCSATFWPEVIHVLLGLMPRINNNKSTPWESLGGHVGAQTSVDCASLATVL